MENYKNKYLVFTNKDLFDELRNNIIKSRESKNISQEQASKILNIDQHLIINIENGDLKKINNNIFTLGHIRTYLKWLNIDHNIFFNNLSFKSTESEKPIKKSNVTIIYKLLRIIVFPITNILGDKFGKKIITPITTLISVMASILIIFIWHQYSNKGIVYNDDKNNYQNEKIKNDNIYNNGHIRTETAENKNKKINNIKFIEILAKDDSWIEIQNNSSKIIISKFLKKNENISIKYEKGLRLVTENAGGINIKVNDTIIENIGKEGEVKRNISLDYVNLLKFNQ